jgi:hypothetical protein
MAVYYNSEKDKVGLTNNGKPVPKTIMLGW